MPPRTVPFKLTWTLGLLVLVGLLTAGTYKFFGLPGIHSLKKSSVDGGVIQSSLPEPSSRTVTLQCPEDTAETASDKLEEEEFTWYHEHSQAIEENVTAFLSNVRNVDDYDEWGLSYEDFKDGMYEWKKKHFADLESGSLIYESACGIGLNLFMTLEILNDEYGVENITVYGNDYVAESVEIAETIVRAGLLPGNGKLGGFCASDSSELPFVPSNTFDLVFTGYISPLQNPLQLNASVLNNSSTDYYVDLCDTDEDQSDVAQEIQNEWYAKWVGEMIRIAKPGASIIVEQISTQICDNAYDWGGVAAEFWTDAIDKYQWDVDPLSMEMEDDELFERYHVFLRKNKAGA